jgi:hypothetical protein
MTILRRMIVSGVARRRSEMIPTEIVMVGEAGRISGGG